MHTAIVLDTEVFFKDPHLEKLPFQLLRLAMESASNTVLLVSEVVVIERVNQYKSRIADLCSAYEKSASELKRHMKEHFQPTSVDNKAKNILVSEYEHRFRAILVDELRAEIVPIPRISHSMLVKRAAQRRRPFDEKGRGYNDTMIWLSIVAAIKQMKPSRLHLVTNNHSDFYDPSSGELLSDLKSDLRKSGLEPTVKCFKDLQGAIDATFPKPPRHDLELDSEWQRNVIESYKDQIFEQLGEDLAADYDTMWYQLESLGNDFRILRTRAVELGSRVLFQIGVRFWHARITQLREIKGWDVFTQHEARIDSWVNFQVSPSDKIINAISASVGEVVSVGRQLSKRRSRIE